MKHLVITQRALKDIQEIWDHVATDSEEAADRVKDQIEKQIAFLCEFPGIGHRRADVSNPAFRFSRAFSYVIGYRLKGSKLIVSRVVHGAQNFKSVFKKR